MDDELREIEVKRIRAMSAEEEHNYIFAEILIEEDIPYLLQQLREVREALRQIADSEIGFVPTTDDDWDNCGNCTCMRDIARAALGEQP